MYTALLIVYVFIALALIGLVLLQHGKGADVGAAFGAGASGTVFGSRGAGSFLSRATAVLAAAFFILSIVLAYLSGNRTQPTSVLEQVQPAAPQSVEPAAPETKTDTETADVPAVPPAPADTPQDVPALPAE